MVALATTPVVVAAGNSTITGGDGDDTINAAAGNSFISGGAGNDNITWVPASAPLDGGIGNDINAAAGVPSMAATVRTPST
jgi:Ca2+-binding RTX toxin-like protein